MPREAALFEEAGGSVVRGYILLKDRGGNIPPNWITRAEQSRRARQEGLEKILKDGRISDVLALEDWELAYQKECFYYGIRCLLELDREGTTEL